MIVKKPKLYIAGPMTNIANFNFHNFDRVANDYRQMGYDVVNPAQHDREEGFEGMGRDGTVAELKALGITFDLTAALLWDLEQISASDGVVLLNGWRTSRGARAEVSLAACIDKLVQFEGYHEWRSAHDVFLHHWIDD